MLPVNAIISMKVVTQQKDKIDNEKQKTTFANVDSFSLFIIN